MAAAVAGYRRGLVTTGWPVPLLSCTNEPRKWSFCLVGTLFVAFFGRFQCSLVGGAVIIAR